MGRRIQILAITGVGRSGSTLLEKILGQHEDFFPIGEFAMLWGEMNHDFLCNCGESFFECAFWTQVFERASGGFEGIDADEILKIRQSVDRNYYIPLIRNPALRPKGYQKKLSRFIEVLSSIYSSISELSGDKIILDSSKSPAYFHILSLVPEVELTIIHLVRDSRAVAYSWQKKKRMTYSVDREQYIEQQGAAEAAIKWAAKNVVANTLKPIAKNYVFVRYEDFATEPEKTTQYILKAIGKESTEIDSLMGGNAAVTETHGILGNPTPRSQKQGITIRQDNEWHEKLPQLDKSIVTLLTLPLLAKYGYLSD
ncbi:MAG: sulfotransferase [Cyanobacteria bacterium J06650_10]